MTAIKPFPPRPRVAVVIVTRNRPQELRRLLLQLEQQSPPPSDVIVVDNGDCPLTARLCIDAAVLHLRSEANLGGAGGFALGSLMALARGAEWLWLWDDDGWPREGDCLARLLDRQRAGGAAIVSPLVLDAENAALCAFPFRLGGRRLLARTDVQRRAVIPGQVHLFNGALMPAATFHRFGMPDTRLFIRGDEVDFMLRVMRGGGRVETLTSATACHPSGMREAKPVLGGLLLAAVPPDELRRGMMFRNRAHVARLHRRWAMLGIDVLRYGTYFLARRQPDWAGFRHWLSSTGRGLRGELGAPAAMPPAATLQPAAAPALKTTAPHHA